ncbi:MAG: hypothetical protein Q8O00_10270, partial [Holophaga sp.]|nr:hypothetical protein [Holophaga sp.]
GMIEVESWRTWACSVALERWFGIIATRVETTAAGFESGLIGNGIDGDVAGSTSTGMGSEIETMAGVFNSG